MVLGQVFVNRRTSLRAESSSQVFAGSRTASEDKVPGHRPECSEKPDLPSKPVSRREPAGGFDSRPPPLPAQTCLAVSSMDPNALAARGRMAPVWQQERLGPDPHAPRPRHRRALPNPRSSQTPSRHRRAPPADSLDEPRPPGRGRRHHHRPPPGRAGGDLTPQAKKVLLEHLLPALRPSAAWRSFLAAPFGVRSG